MNVFKFLLLPFITCTLCKLCWFYNNTVHFVSLCMKATVSSLVCSLCKLNAVCNQNVCFYSNVQMVGLHSCNHAQRFYGRTRDSRQAKYWQTRQRDSFFAFMWLLLKSHKYMWAHVLLHLFVLHFADLCDCVISSWLHEAIYTVGWD